MKIAEAARLSKILIQSPTCDDSCGPCCSSGYTDYLFRKQQEQCLEAIEDEKYILKNASSI